MSSICIKSLRKIMKLTANLPCSYALHVLTDAPANLFRNAPPFSKKIDFGTKSPTPPNSQRIQECALEFSAVVWYS